ncbi:MAG: succinylglutamate desuccinylase/aspartoacylase family protein [Myxococcota bacterium]
MSEVARISGADLYAFGGRSVEPGQRMRVDLPIAEPYGAGTLTLPVQVVRGKTDGPRLFVSAALHGDEINGVEIIRRLLRHRALKRLRGMLVALPVVNVYGFMARSRYLPDRRDLNRSFPGSSTGSLAARLAHLVMTQLVARCTHGVDLHTAAVDRSNLPQIRADLGDEQTRRLSLAFGAPVVIDAQVRDGSLRQSVSDLGMPMLLYEAGEALRFDEVCIRAGLRGLLRVMAELGMVPAGASPRTRVEPVVVKRSRWVRAPSSGVLRNRARLGAVVEKGQLLGRLADPTGDDEMVIEAPCSGVLIGRTQIPLLNEGDAAYHIASFDDSADPEESVMNLQNELDPEGRRGPAGEPPIS